MKKELAVECAIHRAKKTGVNYVAIKASNGQWMCERSEAIKDLHYSPKAERIEFDPHYTPKSK